MSLPEMVCLTCREMIPNRAATTFPQTCKNHRILYFESFVFQVLLAIAEKLGVDIVPEGSA